MYVLERSLSLIESTKRSRERQGPPLVRLVEVSFKSVLTPLVWCQQQRGVCKMRADCFESRQN